MRCPAGVPEWLFVLYQAAIGFPPISEGTEQAAASSQGQSWEEIVLCSFILPLQLQKGLGERICTDF